MSSVFLVLMHVTVLGTNQGSFEQAYQQSLTSGRPLVVLIGATWCPACQTMKNAILPQVAQAGGLDNTVFFYVDYDQQRQLATRLQQTTSIPQLLRFDRTSNGWKSQCLVGAKAAREVYHFVSARRPEEPAAAVAPAAYPYRTANSDGASHEPPRSDSRLPSHEAGGLAHYWMVFRQAFSAKPGVKTTVDSVAAGR